MRFDGARTRVRRRPTAEGTRACVTFRLGILGRPNAALGHGNVLIGITRNVTRYATHAAFAPRNRVILVHGRMGISGGRGAQRNCDNYLQLCWL